MKNKALPWFGLIALVIIGGGFLLFRANNTPAPLDEFAACIKEKGAVFYGAFWCPHCQNQKKVFGASAKKLAYVECSTPNGKEQLPICIDNKIEGYPTWTFADGSRESGELSLARLAEKTGCPFPNTEDLP